MNRIEMRKHLETCRLVDEPSMPFHSRINAGPMTFFVHGVDDDHIPDLVDVLRGIGEVSDSRPAKCSSIKDMKGLWALIAELEAGEDEAENRPGEFTIKVDGATVAISPEGIEIQGGAYGVSQNELLSHAIRLVDHVTYMSQRHQEPEQDHGCSDACCNEPRDGVDQAFEGDDPSLTVSEITDMLAAFIADAELAELNVLGEQLRRFLSAIYGSVDFPSFVGIDRASAPDFTAVHVQAGDPPGSVRSAWLQGVHQGIDAGRFVVTKYEECLRKDPNLNLIKFYFDRTLQAKKYSRDLVDGIPSTLDSREDYGSFITLPVVVGHSHPPLSPSVRDALEYAKKHGCSILHMKADGSLEAFDPREFYLHCYGERHYADGSTKTMFVPRPRNENSAGRG